MMTNAVEVLHHSLKTYAKRKKAIKTIFFSCFISYVLNIDDQWEQQAWEVRKLWFKTWMVKFIKYPELAQFSSPVSLLIVNQFKTAKKINGKFIYWRILFLNNKENLK